MKTSKARVVCGVGPVDDGLAGVSRVLGGLVYLRSGWPRGWIGI